MNGEPLPVEHGFLARMVIPGRYGFVSATKWVIDLELTTIAGVAWAQHVGIVRVEVRVDGGAWRPAVLATEVNDQTWRMWRVDVDLRPGTHIAEVRATDRDGQTQTRRRVQPIPDGATGWHSRQFTVTTG